MGWSEIIKAVNSNISVPLNKLITSAKDSLDAAITSAKNELSTLIKKNGTSYPNVTVGTLAPGEKIEVAGKGKVTIGPVNGYTTEAKISIDNKLLPSTFRNLALKTLTFEKNINLLNSYTSQDSKYSLLYLLQLTE